MNAGTALVVWGAGGHGRVVADIVRLAGQYEIAAFIDDNTEGRLGSQFCDAPFAGDRQVLPELRRRGVAYALIAVGDCALRLRLADYVGACGFLLATAIHPHAIVARDTQIGPGSVVAAGAVLNPGAVIGANVIVNTAATIDHECVIADGVHIAPGAHLAGNVHVGRGALVGICAAVIEGIDIGEAAIIGAGAVVVTDIPRYTVAYGVPARVRRHLPAPSWVYDAMRNGEHECSPAT